MRLIISRFIGTRLVRSSKLLFLLWAFACHVASLITIEAPAFFLVAVFVVFCVGTLDSSEYRWVHIHWSRNVIRMASVLTCTGVFRCGPLVLHIVLSFEGLSSCELLHFVLGCGNPFVKCGRLVISV